MTRALLQAVLWWLPPCVWAVCELVVQAESDTPGADTIALAAGFSSRYQMTRALRRCGLPALTDLAVWLHCIDWIIRCEEGQQSLCALRLGHGRDPAAAYRAIRRVTGLGWKAVLKLGGVGAVTHFASQPALTFAARIERARREVGATAGRTLRRSGGWAVAGAVASVWLLPALSDLAALAGAVVAETGWVALA